MLPENGHPGGINKTVLPENGHHGGINKTILLENGYPGGINKTMLPENGHSGGINKVILPEKGPPVVSIKPCYQRTGTLVVSIRPCYHRTGILVVKINHVTRERAFRCVLTVEVTFCTEVTQFQFRTVKNGWVRNFSSSKTEVPQSSKLSPLETETSRNAQKHVKFAKSTYLSRKVNFECLRQKLTRLLTFFLSYPVINWSSIIPYASSLRLV